MIPRRPWQTGCIAYQILVDRFAPPDDYAAKSRLLVKPARLRKWSALPEKGKYLERPGVWSHELDFWGGDLGSLSRKLPYLEGLGVEAVYLNPIFRALTNHKYDTADYHEIDPAFGTHKDLAALAQNLHDGGCRLILDGVFNHKGLSSPLFAEAVRDPNSPSAGFFRKVPVSPHVRDLGHDTGEVGRTEDRIDPFARWAGVGNLPELDLESPAVAELIYRGPDSVVRRYLREFDIDGWRLDVADEMGADFLSALTAAAHDEKKDSLVLGEVWNYPGGWSRCLDGVMNMHFRQLVLSMLQGRSDGPSTACRIEKATVDAGSDFIGRCWNVMDNHDTPRLNSIIADPGLRRAARVLQFCLPGGVCVYYGSELAMEGGEDPGMRAPMRWDLARDDNETLGLFKRLIWMKKNEPALRHGDFQALASRGLMAFMRRSGGVENTIVVAVNPTAEKIGEILQLPDYRIHDSTRMADLLGGPVFISRSGTVDLTLGPGESVVLRPVTGLRSGEDNGAEGCFKYKHRA